MAPSCGQFQRHRCNSVSAFASEALRRIVGGAQLRDVFLPRPGLHQIQLRLRLRHRGAQLGQFLRARAGMQQVALGDRLFVRGLQLGDFLRARPGLQPVNTA